MLTKKKQNKKPSGYYKNLITVSCKENPIEYKRQWTFLNKERKKLLEWEREAAINARNEDAEFWRREREKQAEKEKQDREALAAFWEAYRKRAQKDAEDSRPSKLNFGIL
jgi:hypothetical protein